MKPIILFRSTLLATVALGLAVPGAMAGTFPASPLGSTLSLADRSGPLHAIAYSNTVLQIQQELARQGFDPGPADGLMGARTRGAIIAYQQRSGLSVTGQPSMNLLDHIRGRAAAPAVEAGDARDIRDIQRTLGRLGYDVEVTGSVDARTRAAIREYERDSNLLVTGNPSQALQAHLRDNARDTRRGRDEPAVTATTLAEIQRGLRQRGYDIDAASGQMDTKTTAAIRAYQRDSGMRETGTPDQNLADALQVGVPPPVTSPANIRAVQNALNMRGYSAGPADGVMGPSTRNAIQQFRASSGLGASGGLDNDLLAALGIAAAAGAAATGTGTDASAATAATGAASTAAPTYVLRWGDDFNDGNYHSNPPWSVIAGDFQVVQGALQSSVGTETAPQSQEQMGREVITGVLGQVFGMQTGAAGASRTAAISQDTGFSDAFRISLRISGTPGSNARMNLGPYQGRNVAHGYRLVYEAGSSRPLSIVASSDSGVRTAVSSSSAPNLADGQWHKLVWSRDNAGQMLVTINDQPYLSATDRGLQGSNAGFSFVNQMGTWRIDDIAVETP